MSSVTINELAWDYKHNTMQKELVESCDIEVVPRKMVEMIIEKCIEEDNCICSTLHQDDDDFDYFSGYVYAMGMIKVFANSLLKQFEEDK